MRGWPSGGLSDLRAALRTKRSLGLRPAVRAESHGMRSLSGKIHQDAVPGNACRGSRPRPVYRIPISFQYGSATPHQIDRFTADTTKPSLHHAAWSTYPAPKKIGAGPVE